MRYQGTFGDEGNVLCLDYGGGYIDIYIFKCTLKQILKMGSFDCI